MKDVLGMECHSRLRIQRERGFLHDRIEEIVGSEHLLVDNLEREIFVPHRRTGVRLDVVLAPKSSSLGKIRRLMDGAFVM